LKLPGQDQRKEVMTRLVDLDGAEDVALDETTQAE